MIVVLILITYDSGANFDNIGGWNEDAPTIFDGYSGEFWGVKTGHWDATIPATGLPRITNGAGGYQIPLDTAYIIPKFSFSTNGGSRTDQWVKQMAAGTLDGDYSLLIQKVVFGTGALVTFKDLPNVMLSKAKTSAVVDLNQYFVASEPVVFSAEQMQGSHLSVSVSNGILSLSQKDNYCYPFSEIVTVKAISNGQVFSKSLAVSQSEIVSTPIAFNVIPDQIVAGSTTFQNINLNQFISSSSSIIKPTYSVTTTEPSMSFSITSNQQFVAKATDPTWMGAAVATVKAIDQCGNNVQTHTCPNNFIFRNN